MIGLTGLLCASLCFGQESSLPTPGQAPTSQLRLDPSIKRTFVPLSRDVPGALYEPVNPGERSHIGLLVMHSDGNYITYNACFELSKRGYTVLCANASNGGGLDRVLFDAKLGVDYLHSYPGIKKVLLFGHSGGATVMTAYQAIAENGPKFCQGPEKLYKCSGKLAGLQRADGIVMADAHWGNAVMALLSIDPAVVDDGNGRKINPSLDLWNPKNGFNPKGSDYSAQFIRAFQAGVAARNARLIKSAEDRLELVEAGKGTFLDDEPFTIAGASTERPNMKLFAQDPQLLSHTQHAWPLLHPDGSITNEVIHSLRIPEGAKSLTPYLANGGVNTTVREYLANSAVRVAPDFSYNEDSIHGIDWNSTYSCPPGNVESISVPVLVMGMTGHWDYLSAETIYEHAKSEDKKLIFVQGARHDSTTCKECEKTPGQYGDTLKTTFDYIDGWIMAKGRFSN